MLTVGLAGRDLSAQTGVVGGVVVDARSLRALDNVQVGVEGTSQATITDANGRFRFVNVAGTQVTLQLRRIGFQPRTERVTVGQTDLRLTLQDQPAVLNEVVVTGTAEPEAKRALGNSLTKVAAADVQGIAPSENATNLINGRAPGVVISAGSGAVGSGPRIRIRGANSFSLSDQPLVYIDGVRMASDVSTGPTSQAFGSSVISRLNDISPDDIESIEIVKGPAAATLYGTEASNGVIQIITKRGRAGPTAFTLTAREGTNWFMDAEKRIGLTYNRDPTTNAIRTWNPVSYERSLGNTLFQNGMLQNYTLGANGGTDAVRYNVIAGYDNEKGIEPTNSLWRYNGNASITVNARPNLDFSANIHMNQQQINVPLEAGDGLWFDAYFGQYPYSPDEIARHGMFSAPPDAWWGAFKNYQNVQRLTASLTTSHRIGTWFSQRLTVGNDFTDENNVGLTQRLAPFYAQFFTDPSTQEGGKSSTLRQLNVTSLDYAATAKANLFNRAQSSTSFGAQFFRRDTYTLAASGQGFPAAGLSVIDASPVNFGGENFLRNTTVGFYGQEMLSFRDRLFLTGAIRVDDNSAFGTNFKWVTYPKLAASYVISEEPWWKLSTLNTFKLRAAYGETGQQPATNSALRTYVATTAGNGGSGVTPNTLGNPNLKPERGKELELGFEGSAFKERVGFDFTFYHKNTTDAIVAQNVAPSSGFAGTQLTNIGEISGQGVEMSARFNAVNKRNFNLDFNANYSHNNNHVVALAPGQTILGTGNLQIVKNYPVGGYWDRVIVSAQFDPSRPGRTMNELCQDGKGGTTPCLNASGGIIAPRVFIGRSDAPNDGSVSSTATFFSRFRVYGLVDFKQGNRQFDNNRRARCQVFDICLENLEPANYPATLIAQYNSPNLLRTIFYGDASYAKLRELSVSYALPDRWARKIGGGAASFTMSGRNLHTWTKWSGVDPESYFSVSQYARTEQAQVPPLAVFLTSFNITF